MSLGQIFQILLFFSSWKHKIQQKLIVQRSKTTREHFVWDFALQKSVHAGHFRATLGKKERAGGGSGGRILLKRLITSKRIKKDEFGLTEAAVIFFSSSVVKVNTFHDHGDLVSPEAGQGGSGCTRRPPPPLTKAKNAPPVLPLEAGRRWSTGEVGGEKGG